MRKLKLQMQITLDGFVAGPNGEGDFIWASGADPAGKLKVAELSADCDTLLLGRKMVPGFIEHWENVADNQPDSPENPFAKRIVNMRKIVFSRTITTVTGRNTEVENGDLVTVVQALKSQPGQNIIVYGGANFVSSLISHNLIDEYYILICPIAIVNGLSIFKERKLLKLESSTAFKNGKVLNKYLPV